MKEASEKLNFGKKQKDVKILNRKILLGANIWHLFRENNSNFDRSANKNVLQFGRLN
jgi:hypothetical protein